MKKIAELILEECWDCIDCQEKADQGKDFRRECLKEKKVIPEQIITDCLFPSWCPLEDAPESREKKMSTKTLGEHVLKTLNNLLASMTDLNQDCTVSVMVTMGQYFDLKNNGFFENNPKIMRGEDVYGANKWGIEKVCATLCLRRKAIEEAVSERPKGTICKPVKFNEGLLRNNIREIIKMFGGSVNDLGDNKTTGAFCYDAMMVAVMLLKRHRVLKMQKNESAGVAKSD